MEVVALIEQLLLKVLSATSVPAWLQVFVMDLVKKYLTPELVEKLKKELTCYVCAQVKALADASKDNKIDDALAAIVCKALGGEDCKA